MDDLDRAIVVATQEGLPLSLRPYDDVARSVGAEPSEVMTRMKKMLESGVIRRNGVVPNHYALGYKANGMTVWDVPDDQISALGRRVGALDFVSHCYHRPRHLPDWPYNLFCMVHGRERATVLDQIDQMVDTCGLHDINHDVLFSARRFKQRGAHYAAAPRTLESVA